MPESTPPTSTDFQLSAMIAQFQRDKAAVVDQRKEVGVLIKQTVAEIDRLAQRHRDIPSQIRQLEANPEAFPRAEIQRRYAEAREAQMRQFMMQGQLEQLRAREANLERVAELLDRILVVIDSLQASPSGGPRAELSGALSSASPQDKMAEAALQSIELAHHRISRQLQDSTAQAISDLILRAEVCLRLMDLDQTRARGEMADLKQAASSALKSTRQLFYDLEPPTLEESGLAAALTRYVESCRAAEKLRIGLQVVGDEKRLPPRVELGVFRVVQEALANAERHSDAGIAEISLRFEPDQLIATVADEGRGFDVGPALAEAAQKSHSGLADMQLRASLIGGSLEIISKAGEGCTVRLTVPC